MFKISLIGTSLKFKPLKKRESGIPVVKFATELVEIKLQELCFYPIVGIKDAPLGTADFIYLYL